MWQMIPKLNGANKVEIEQTKQLTETTLTDRVYKRVEQMEYTNLLVQPTEASSRNC